MVLNPWYLEECTVKLEVDFMWSDPELKKVSPRKNLPAEDGIIPSSAWNMARGVISLPSLPNICKDEIHSQNEFNIYFMIYFTLQLSLTFCLDCVVDLKLLMLLIHIYRDIISYISILNILSFLINFLWVEFNIHRFTETNSKQEKDSKSIPIL